MRDELLRVVEGITGQITDQLHRTLEEVRRRDADLLAFSRVKEGGRAPADLGVLAEAAGRPEALAEALLAVADAEKPQRVRLGRQWLAGESIRPGEDLYIDQFRQWFRANVHARLDPRREAGANPSTMEILDRDGAATLDAAAILEAGESLAELVDALTPREHEVLALLLDGADTGEVARELGIAPATVRVLRARIQKKSSAA